MDSEDRALIRELIAALTRHTEAEERRQAFMEGVWEELLESTRGGCTYTPGSLTNVLADIRFAHDQAQRSQPD